MHVTTHISTPTRVQGALVGAKVVQVATGSRHTACVTEDGALYTWGKGASGRLGLGNSSDTDMPTLVQGELVGNRVVEVTSGDAHTACVTEDGALYTWGAGDNGKLGHGPWGHDSNATVPTLVQSVRVEVGTMQMTESQDRSALVAEEEEDLECL